jgi:hypothetical protein
VAPIDDAWVAILDYSIDIGIKKVLVVLRVSLGALAARGSALQLEDCQCIGIQVSEKTDGETIAAGLGEIFERAGAPVAIIKDGGRDLARGVELWQSEVAAEVEVIDDIGHVTANALKAQYAKSKLFASFLSIINHCAKRLRQTRLAFLAPPKLRTKGRFQGISKFAVRSSHTFTAFKWSHKWVVLSILIRFPFSHRPWALPALVTLYTPPEVSRKMNRHHRTPSQSLQVL